MAHFGGEPFQRSVAFFVLRFMFSSGRDLSGHVCEICLHPHWKEQPEKPWLWVQIRNHQFAAMIYNSKVVAQRNWKIKVLGELMYRECSEIDPRVSSSFWVDIKLNWVAHGHYVIDVSEVAWHISLGTYLCLDEDLTTSGDVAMRIKSSSE